MYVGLFAGVKCVSAPKIAPRRPRENSAQWKFLVGCFNIWHMDFITDLPLSQGFNAIYTCVNKFTKMVKLQLCFVGEGQLTTKEVVTLFFNGVVRTYGLPRVVLHNRDPRLTSHFWKSLWALLGVRVALSMAHHPQTDGQTERVHCTLEQTLRCVLVDR